MSGCDKGQMVHETKILSSWPFTDRQFTQFLPRYSQAADTPPLGWAGPWHRSEKSWIHEHQVSSEAPSEGHGYKLATPGTQRHLAQDHLLAEETLLMVFLKSLRMLNKPLIASKKDLADD